MPLLLIVTFSVLLTTEWATRIAATASASQGAAQPPISRVANPSYVPYVDAQGIWNLFSSGAPAALLRLKVSLEESWKPYLNGRGTRDEAMRSLREKIAAMQ